MTTHVNELTTSTALVVQPDVKRDMICAEMQKGLAKKMENGQDMLRDVKVSKLNYAVSLYIYIYIYIYIFKT